MRSFLARNALPESTKISGMIPSNLRAGKNKKKLLVPENGPFGTPFLTPKIPLKKFMWVPFVILSQEMRHINFFLGAQIGVFFFWGGCQKVHVEKVCALCPSLANDALAFGQAPCVHHVI